MFALATEPYWKKDLIPGVDVMFRPIEKPMIAQARKAMRADIEAQGVDPDDVDYGQATEAFTEALLRQAVVGWAGIGDLAGEALPFSVETLAAVLRNPDLRDAMDRFYAAPVLIREAEKNVSSPASNGTAAGETAAETTAKGATPTAARTAPTKPTRLKRG